MAVALLLSQAVDGAMAAGDRLAAQMGITALTHVNKATSRRATYTEPKVSRVKRPARADRQIWPEDVQHIDVICFEDGNNAVVMGVQGKFYAANGKAEQFIRHGDGDGLIVKGKVEAVHELGSEPYYGLASIARDTGLKQCGQKSVEEIAEAVNEATPRGEDDRETVLAEIAFGLWTGSQCDFQADEPGIAAYLRKTGIDTDNLRADIEPFVLGAAALIGKPTRSQCRGEVWTKYGRDGIGILTR